MATNQNLPATDSAAVLHELVGDDATAAFENNPTFSDANPTAGGSSENLQTRADRRDIQAQPDLKLAAEDDDEDEDDEDEDEDDDLDDEDDEDEDDDLDDDEDEDDDDEEYEDDDDEEDDEDAEDEDE